MGVDDYKLWTPQAQQRALERLREARNEQWRPFYCEDARCDGQPHDKWGWPHARSDQRPPADPDYFCHLICAGRGSGKTRTGSELTHRVVKRLPRIIIVAPTSSDLRDVIVDGDSGIMATSPPGFRPHFEPTKRRLTWPNGALATLISAEEPERLRGPQCLVAGTMIQTEYGLTPIEEVVVGDHVWTRRGLRQVTNTMSSVREVMTLRHPHATITGTFDHRVWTTNRGWVELQFIRPTDILDRWENRTSTPLPVGAISSRGGVTPCSIPAGFGFSTMARSPMGTKFITSMGIGSMTGSRTLSASPGRSTSPFTPRWNTSTSALLAEKRSPARVAALHAADARTAGASADANNSHGLMRSVGTDSSFVVNAASSFRPVVGRSAHSGASTSGPMHRVYDLTVEEEPEFYANGILVHNSYWSWMDEAAIYPRIDDVWSNLLLGLRLGSRPRVLVTTTPKPRPWMKQRLSDARTRVARASTYDNLGNLAPTFAEEVVKQYEGTRIGRQELHAELLTDVEGALWTWEMLEESRLQDAPEGYDRVVVGVDPAGTAKKGSDETGIVVAGISGDEVYILADLSGRYSPHRWATVVRNAYDTYEADAIIPEVNYGADMVTHTLRSSGVTARIIPVVASRGKSVRAEPVVALFEQNRAHIVGSLPALEEEMATWVPGESRVSPGRVDAMVWAVTALSKKNARANIASPLRLVHSA